MPFKNDSQKQQFADHVRANPDPTIVAALTIRADDTIRDWYNTADVSNTNVWNEAVSGDMMFNEMSIPQYNNINQQPLRESWNLMIQRGDRIPLDFGLQRNRNAVRDIWVTAQADALLTAFRRLATRCEMLYGGTIEASGTVSATDLNLEIKLTSYDVTDALNNF